MRVIERPRAGGKTYQLVQEMLKPGNEDMVYVAPTMHQAREIGLQTALSLGAKDTPQLRSRFIPASALPGRVRGKNVRLVVDEVDGVIGHLFGAPVAYIAHTPSEVQR